jgi:hypothetical protein
METYTITEDELNAIYDDAVANIETTFKGDSDEVLLTRRAYLAGIRDALQGIWAKDRKILGVFRPDPLPGQRMWD